MKYIVPVFILLFSFSSCQNQNEVIIDEDKMVQILADLHIIEASLNVVSAAQRDSFQEIALEKCAEIHNISIEELELQIMYIDQRPEYHRALYKRVIDTLESFMKSNDEKKIPDDIPGKIEGTIEKPIPSKPKPKPKPKNQKG